MNLTYKPALLCGIALFLGTVATWSQSIISSEYGQAFRSIGIDTNGRVIILGGSGGGTVIVYELTETGFHITQLPPLAYDGYADDARMSRDGQCVVTDDIHGDIVTPALWVRTQSDRWLHPNQAPDNHLYATDVASTPDGPFVVCGGYPTSQFWTLDQGIFPWIANEKPFVSALRISRLSRDGKKFAGFEAMIRREGDPVVIRAIAGTKTNYSYLVSHNRTNCQATAISPNGRFIVGRDYPYTVVWQDGKSRVWPFGKHIISFSDTVTDNGFVGGRWGAEVAIYDPRSRKAYTFSDWWARRYPQTPLPGRIRNINDLYEYRGNLYCLLSAHDDAIVEDFSILAIAPIKGLPSANPKCPERGYGRMSGIAGWQRSK